MKHPVLINGTRLTVWWLVWLFLALGQALLYYLLFNFQLYLSILDSLLSLILYSGIALSLWYPFNIFNREGAKPLSLVSNIITIGTISVTLWIFSSKMLLLLLVPDREVYNNFWDQTIAYRAGAGVFIYFLIILSYFLFVSLTNLSDKKAREAKLESLVRETELKMLRSQINPHFLFNSLNSISSLTVTNPDKARDMVIKLSDFMRYALSRKDEVPVPLSAEFENLRLYLEIEKVRFGDRLKTEELINGDCLEIMVPVMILQPLYENAVKHGVYESTGNILIRSEAKINDGYLELSISNNYEEGTSPVKGTGTGLLNVKRRLELTYGNRSRMLTEKQNGIFTVKLFIPR